MWQRFEAFWTAFEKFALFFSFAGTLVALVVLVLIYSSLTELRVPPPMSTPTPQPTPPVAPVIEVMRQGFEKIQGAVSPAVVPISHTVPITLNIRINSDQLELKLVGKGELRTGRVVINLDDAGKLVGKDATMELPEGNKLKVQLDLNKQVVFSVPIQVAIPIDVPNNIDLAAEIESLKNIGTTLDADVGLVPQVAGQAP
jgi:hypothetical protein